MVARSDILSGDLEEFLENSLIGSADEELGSSRQ
jgi:hypothetical protein